MTTRCASIQKLGCLIGLICIFWAIPAHAACSGSGTTWSCSAGAAVSDVNSVINSATDGATVTFAAGSYNWGDSTITPSLSKGITFMCASGAACTVSAGNTVFGFSSGSSSKLYRISGFTFNLSSYLLWTCPSGGCTGTLSQVRFDHNTITESSASQVILQVGENTSKQYVYGVADHNTVRCSSSCYFFHWIDDEDDSPPGPPLGTINNFFLEDNTITITTLTDNGTGCTDGWGQSAEVLRHNTITNCRALNHGNTHGGGPANYEVYNNSITMNSNSGIENQCYRCIHTQGSNTFLVFNNTLNASAGMDPNAIVFQHYRDFANGIDGASPYGECDGTKSPDGNRSPQATYKGYPCWRQPGRDITGAYKPMYLWNNKGNGSRIDGIYNGGGSSPDYSGSHMQQNREWYLGGTVAQTSPTSPFNGNTSTDGVGFGTLANRPSTCTTSTESGAGVGYFATDQGAQGTLYTCSATNAWSVYYVPYTYPHPLVTGSGGSGGGPSPPTSLAASVQ